ncbi:hypothetical protein Fmac_029398 [Flemingia macrophylla]|uniref:Uncharacterized protein n=1 Tax=Flemingia macrophylla TaxID=520843 RepID=A0ABD1LA79_9FABA
MRVRCFLTPFLLLLCYCECSRVGGVIGNLPIGLESNVFKASKEELNFKVIYHIVCRGHMLLAKPSIVAKVNEEFRVDNVCDEKVRGVGEGSFVKGKPKYCFPMVYHRKDIILVFPPFNGDCGDKDGINISSSHGNGEI